MPQTKEGAGHSAWLLFLKDCAQQYHERKKAGALAPASMNPSVQPVAKRRRINAKQPDPTMPPPPAPPKRFAKLKEQTVSVDLDE